MLFTLIRLRAVTVSVAHKTLLSSITSDILSRWSKKMLLKKFMQAESATNENIVPKMPRKVMSPRFWKNSDFRRLYPAANMIGGRMKVKNTSFENMISCLNT